MLPISGADLTGANLENTIIVDLNDDGSFTENVDLTNANLNGLFGLADLSKAVLSNTTCPDGSNSDDTSCVDGVLPTPPPLAAPLFPADTQVTLEITKYSTEMYYMGVHEYFPGIDSSVVESTLIIGEGKWRSLVGNEAADNYTSTTWIVRVDGVEGDDLESASLTT